MNMKNVRIFLLAASAFSALIAAVGPFASARAGDALVPSLKAGLNVNSHKEELVSRLIVKPHSAAGAKLAHSLQLHDSSELTQIANVGMSVVRPMWGGAHVVQLNQPVSLGKARSIAAQLMKDGSVELAEPDILMHPTALTPTDPSYGSQWHYFAPSGSNLGGANLPNAWSTTTGSASVTVAVIDTGYRQHADLGTVLPGYDFITDLTAANDGDGRDADAQDPGDWATVNQCGQGEPASRSSWHGTHVAGTVAALMNNGLGVTGIAPNIRILPVRVLGRCGGYLSDIVDGMMWAAGFAVGGVPANTHPANVLNMSLGGAGTCSTTEQNAITQIVNAGKVVVVAAGNDGTTTVSTPANCAGVIAVTAHAIDGDNAYYSNVGPEVAISAPGGGCGAQARLNGCTFGSTDGPGVYSLLNSGTQGPVSDSYANYQGTSMATPHVSAVIALMLSVNPALTPAQIKSYLQTSSRPHPAGSTCAQGSYLGLCGAGLLDAAAALTAVSNLPPTISLVHASQVVAPGSTVTLASTVTPASGRTITTYTWTQVSGAAVGTISNANTATASFIAPATGTYGFQLTVTDSAGQSSSAAESIHVNTAPVLTAVADQTTLAGHALTFSVSATDVDGDTLTFVPLSKPVGASLSSSGVFTWANPAVPGIYLLSYYAYDGYASSTTGIVNITVTGTIIHGVAASGGAGGGGGGSMDGRILLILTLLSVSLRLQREYARRRAH
jgi:serine protease